jgi:hypothetical protein
MFKIAKIRDDYLSNARVSKKAPKYIEKNKYAIVMLKSLSIFKKKVTIQKFLKIRRRRGMTIKTIEIKK